MANQFLRINLIVLVVLLLLLKLHGLLLGILLLLLCDLHLHIYVVLRTCSLLFRGSHNQVVVAWVSSRVHLPSINIANHTSSILGVLVLCELGLGLSLLSVAELARSLGHNDILHIVVDGKIDSRLLHFDLLVSTQKSCLF